MQIMRQVNKIINEKIDEVAENCLSDLKFYSGIRVLNRGSGKLTGNLEKSWRIVRKSGTGFSRVVVVGTTVTAKNGFPYAKALEEGRGPVTAKNGGYLRFQTRDGQWHRAKSVRSFGGYHFVRDVANKYR